MGFGYNSQLYMPNIIVICAILLTTTNLYDILLIYRRNIIPVTPPNETVISSHKIISPDVQSNKGGNF